MTNFGVSAERIQDLYDVIEYENQENGFGVAEILQTMQQRLVEEKHDEQTKKLKNKGKTATRQSTAARQMNAKQDQLPYQAN